MPWTMNESSNPKHIKKLGASLNSKTINDYLPPMTGLNYYVLSNFAEKDATYQEQNTKHIRHPRHSKNFYEVEVLNIIHWCAINTQN